MLRHRSDFQSLFYLFAYPGLMLWQWKYGITPIPYAFMLLIATGVGVIHHNHTHLPIWRRAGLNRTTDYGLALLQGCPPFVFFPAHIANHHRYNHGPLDETRTYRFGGDHNHALGYLLHPFQAVWALRGTLVSGLSADRRLRPTRYRDTVVQASLIGLLWIGIAAIDFKKFTILVLLPQLYGIHWLLGANYLQHAHADGNSPEHFARNFTGFVNRVWFNIGFHTAHHRQPAEHWSRLRELHQREECLPSALVERSLVAYILRVFLLGSVLPRYRTRSLMKSSGDRPETHEA